MTNYAWQSPSGAAGYFETKGMKMKKNDLESVPAADFSVRGEDVLFTLDGKPKFKLRTDALLRLINAELIKRLRADQGENEELKAIDSLQFFAKVQRLLRRGFSSEEAAKIVGITPQFLRRYLSYGMGKYRDPQQVRNEIERQQQAEGDLCLKKPRRQTDQERTLGIAPEPEYANVPAAAVKDMLKAGRVFSEICEKLDLDEKSFSEWYKLNKPLLDYHEHS